jgi:hypothetical protein
MNRFVAVAAALALVISGIAIGALGTYLVLERPQRQGAFPPRPQGPPPRPGLFTREMELRLNLSDDQKRQIDEVLRKGKEESDAIRQELRPRLDAHLEATRARIAAILTPEQRTKFEALVAEDQRRADRFFIEGPPGPPPGMGEPGRPGGPPPDGPPPR